MSHCIGTRRTSSFVCFALAALWAAPGVGAQTVSGTVTDAASGLPLAGVQVTVWSDQGRALEAVLSDALGSYGFSLAAAGNYVLTASTLGYVNSESPLFTVGTEDPVRLDFRLDADALELEGLQVEVDQLEVARREYALLGVNLLDVGRRFLDPEFVASRWSSRDVGDLVESRGLPGVSVTRSEWGDPPCVSLQRGRTGAGRWTCAQVAVDGQLVNRSMLHQLPLEAISSVLVMTPSEATLVFGTGASGGVIAILTKARAR